MLIPINSKNRSVVMENPFITRNGKRMPKVKYQPGDKILIQMESGKILRATVIIIDHDTHRIMARLHSGKYTVARQVDQRTTKKRRRKRVQKQWDYKKWPWGFQTRMEPRPDTSNFISQKMAEAMVRRSHQSNTTPTGDAS